MKDERTTPNEEKIPLWQVLRKKPTITLEVLAFSIIWVAIFGVFLLTSYNYWNDAIGDGQYKYSDAVYEQMEDLVQEYALEGVGIDDRAIRIGLKSVSENSPKLYVNSLQEVVNTAEEEKKLSSSEAKATQESLDNILQVIKQGENEETKSTKRVSYDIAYQNEEITLTCRIKDGFFLAETTTKLTEDYKIVNSMRNFNSLQEYMEHYRRVFGVRVFLWALIPFVAVMLVFTGVPALLAVCANKIAKRKEKKAQEQESEERTPELEVITSRAEGQS